jgi:hypothetical protein
MWLRSELQRSEQKFGLILRQVAALRRRRNLLALQEGIFVGFAVVIAAGAAMLLAAFRLDSAAFLITVAVLGCAAAMGLWFAARRAARMWTSAAQAASLADRRADLKERLGTLLAVAGKRQPPALWPYLVEDTLNMREAFAPERIERRRISQSIYVLLASCVFAALAAPLMFMPRHPVIASKGPAVDLTVPLDDLQVRTADPDWEAGTEVSADPETMRLLRQKAGAAGGSSQSQGSLSKLADAAASIAGRLQDRLTGRDRTESARIRLKLVQTLQSKPPIDDSPDLQLARRHKHKDKGAGIFDKEGRVRPRGPAPSVDPIETEDNEPENRRQLDAGHLGDTGRGEGSNGAHGGEAAEQSGGDEQGGGDASHGAGSDPEHLFGQATDTPLAAESFEVMINARPAQRGSSPGSRSYLPPKVRTSLNARQHPDEPLARGEVPAADRDVIRRIFER